MGLVKSGIKYGGLIYAVNVVSKSVAAHHENKTVTPPMSGDLQRPQQPPASRSQGSQRDDSGYLHRASAKAIAAMNAMESRIGSKSEQIIIEKCLPLSRDEGLERAAGARREVVVEA